MEPVVSAIPNVIEFALQLRRPICYEILGIFTVRVNMQIKLELYVRVNTSEPTGSSGFGTDGSKGGEGGDYLFCFHLLDFSLVMINLAWTRF